MSEVGPVRQYLVEKLEEKLKEHLVMVWYDPSGAFEEVFEEEPFGGAEKLREDGALRLRQKAEGLTASLRAGIDGQRVLAYVSARPLPERQNLLLPLESLGTAYQATLPEVAQRAFRNEVPAEKVREWLEVPGMTLAKLDEMAVGGASTGALAAVFGEAGAYDTAFRFLAQPILSAELDDKLTALLRELLTDTFAIKLPEAATPEELRDVFAQRVLVREFVEDLEEVPGDLQHLKPAGAGGRGERAAVLELAEALRTHDRLTDDYRRWAAEAQQAFGLDGHDWDARSMGRRDTFGFEERLALAHVVELARAGDWEEAAEWVEERSKSFWARKDQRRRAEWLVARTAVRLRGAVEEALRSMPSSMAPEAWVVWYVGEAGGRSPAWRADRLARELAAHHLTFMNEDALRSLVEIARTRADEFEQRLAERFVDVVKSRPEALADLPQQSAVFEATVAPLLEDGRKVVLVLADALRYEMGRSLAESLEEDGETDVTWATATLPTITKVGMAALLPGAEEGIELRVGGGKVAAAIGGTALPTIVERRKWLEARYGDRFLDLPLDECLQTSLAMLKERIGEADLILLRSQDIDQIGETDSVSHAHSFISHVEQQLHAATRKLTRAGAEEFVVVADHGFILRSDVGEAMKLELPKGDCVEVHRRCVIGRNLDDGDNYARLRCSDLGLAGGLELAFPRGINVFKAGGGNLNYLHGGLSLQEVVVPVIRHTPAAAETPATAATVSLNLVGEKVSNTFFQVKLEYRGQDLFAQAGPRRLRIEALKEGTAVGSAVEASVGYDAERREIALESDQESVAMVGLTEALEGKGQLELRVVDVKLGETLVTKKVPYDLAF